MEFIGLILGLGVMLALSLAVSLILMLLTWLLLRPLQIRKLPVLLSGMFLGPACVVWFYVSVAILPYESLFGDIDQPLPNGYRLQALGKMPDFASIDREGASYGSTGLPEAVGALQVVGEKVVGRYSHPFDSFQPRAKEPYFLLDTATGRHQDYDSQQDLQAQLLVPVHLVATTEFRTEDPSFRRWRQFDTVAIFGPMTASCALYLLAVFAFWRRGRALSGAAMA